MQLAEEEARGVQGSQLQLLTRRSWRRRIRGRVVIRPRDGRGRHRVMCPASDGVSRCGGLASASVRPQMRPARAGRRLLLPRAAHAVNAATVACNRQRVASSGPRPACVVPGPARPQLPGARPRARAGLAQLRGVRPGSYARDGRDRPYSILQYMNMCAGRVPGSWLPRVCWSSTAVK